MNGWSNLLFVSLNSIVALIISLLVSHLYLESPYWSKSQVYLGFTRVTRLMFFQFFKEHFSRSCDKGTIIGNVQQSHFHKMCKDRMDEMCPGNYGKTYEHISG